MTTRATLSRLALFAIFASFALLAACKFEPQIASGSLACGTRQSCPRGLSCHAGVCCASHDDAGACSRDRATPPPDGGARAIDPMREEPDASLEAAAAPSRPEPRRLVEGKVSLVDYRGCTRADIPSSPNRWCAFLRGRELWVLDVTRARSEDVACDGQHPACLRLTEAIYDANGTSVAHVEPHFDGDTLLFSAHALPPEGEDYKGGVYAWRPGWSAATRLTSANGYYCAAAFDAGFAWCLDRGAKPPEAQLLAGALRPETPLPVVKTLPSLAAYADMSDDGQWLAVQDRSATGKSSLIALPTTNPAGERTLATDVVSGQWALSYDNKSGYLLRGNKGSDIDPSATLSIVALDDPSNVVDLASRIGRFRIIPGASSLELGVAGVQDATAGFGLLKLWIGRSPPREITVGQSSEQFAVSRDARYTVFSPIEDSATRRRDLRMADHAASTVCALQKQPQTWLDTSDAFTRDGQLTFWLEQPEPTEPWGDGWLARSSDCSERRRFSRRLGVHFVIGSSGVLYVDEYDGRSGRLTFLPVDKGTPAAAPIPIADGVELFMMPLKPDPRQVVFTSAAPGREGLYFVDLAL